METRREFCQSVCRAASLATIGSILQGCSNPAGPSTSVPSLPSVPASVVNGAVVVTIDAASPLASVGSAASAATMLGTFLIARTAQDSFTVVTAQCTHQACTITGFANQRYVCPCHGSQFTTNGTVVQGPAIVPLAQFANQFANNVLTITV